MSTLRPILTLAAVLALTQTVQAQQGYPVRLDLGTTPTPQDLVQLFAIPPDGRGLPPGKGTYAEGEKVYADSCAVSRRQAAGDPHPWHRRRQTHRRPRHARERDPGQDGRKLLAIRHYAIRLRQALDAVHRARVAQR